MTMTVSIQALYRNREFRSLVNGKPGAYVLTEEGEWTLSWAVPQDPVAN